MLSSVMNSKKQMIKQMKDAKLDDDYKSKFNGKSSEKELEDEEEKSSITRQATIVRIDRKQSKLRSKINEGSWIKMATYSSDRLKKIKGGGRRKNESDHLDESTQSDDDHADGNSDDGQKNSVGTIELFRYANGREKVAVMFGLLFMWYAASWQPISVFILAVMASLMGEYSKRTSWLLQILVNTGGRQQANQTSLNEQAEYEKLTLINSLHNTSFIGNNDTATSSFLSTIGSLLGPILEAFLGSSFENSFNSSKLNFDGSGSDKDAFDKNEIKSAVHEIFDHESRQFLRRSLEINGSAFILAITQLISFFLGMSLITWVARKQASRVKQLYFQSCLHQEAAWFEDRDSAASGSGSSLNALVDKYEDGIGAKLALLSYFLGHVALFTITAFYQQANLASFCFPFVLLVCIVIGFISNWQAMVIGKEALFAKRSLQLVEEIISAIRTVFAFNGQHKELSRYGSSLRFVYRKSIQKHLYTALNTSLSKFSIFACFSIYCFCAMRLFPPYDPVGPKSKSTILAVMRGAEVSIVNILISIPFMEALQQSKGSIARVYAAIQRQSSIDSSANRKNNSTSLGDTKGVKFSNSWLPLISFKSVNFAYTQRGSAASLPELPLKNALDTNDKRPGSKQRQAHTHKIEYTLKQFDLEIAAGQSIALVGPSGSGKSTVLALIQRLYDIDSGQLFIGSRNVEIHELDVAWLRNQIGIVPQEPRLFDISIKENIRLGLNNENDDKEDEILIEQLVLAASKAAGAHAFIKKLPEAYETRVGSGGVQLSGGQKQRIAIARALIRKPKILLLDETTSALDTESEAHVQAAIKEVSEGRTTITVAHRLATIKNADTIVVMSGGKVVEKGRHDELLGKKNPSGLYRQMWDEQQAQQFTQTNEDSSLREHSNNNIETQSALTATSVCKSSDSMNSDSSLKSLDSDEEGRIQGKPTWRQLCQLTDAPKWTSIAAAIVCLIAGLILPMNLIAHSYLFSAFAYEELEQIGDYLHAFGLIILSFSSFVFIVSFLQIIVPGYVGERISSSLRVKTLHSLLAKPLYYFDMEANTAGYLCNRFNSHISSIQNIAGSRIATVLEAVSTLTVGATYGFSQNVSLSLVCLSFALLVLATTIIESRIVQSQARVRQHFDAKLAHLIADALSNIKTIASLNRESYFLRKSQAILDERERKANGFRLNSLCVLLISLKFIMPAISWSTSMYYGCNLLVAGKIDLQTIFIVCPVVLFAVNDTFRALVFLPELMKARNSLEQVYLMNTEFSPQSPQPSLSFHELSNHNQSKTGTTNGLAHKIIDGDMIMEKVRRKSRLNSWAPQGASRGRIEFVGVEFTYPSRPNALVLNGLTFSIGAGENVALVGTSGSGKSSCVALLEKFYPFQAGSVKLDGRDLRLCDTHWVRDQLALVCQEPRLLSYSIADNIKYGNNSRFVRMDEVIEAAKAANIHQFIMSLPEQYETKLSFAGSSLLSGGQRQRIAIARALIRKAPIMIFDEATSALDAQNERLVQETLKEARKGKSCLTIAHRLTTIKDADLILVMREGRLIESGTHRELLKREDGHYRALWRQQQETYPST